ncbi:hypothetical protein BDN72DRAFT_895191 [Pluteus cervinus]|uniref:Uncharacterized protein n=1 Tax=Pluteus cervinus TaxID=181527 RepID=A0ACD3B1N2_9AGAR|nr:hypothetical protein BDN72DRAFT_895191 [Pluteus cervinus]
MQVTFGTNQSTITTGWGHNTGYFHWSDEKGGQHSICQWGCCTRDSWTDNSDSRAELDSRTAQNTSRQRDDIRTGGEDRELIEEIELTFALLHPLEKPSSSRYGVKTVTRSQMNNLNVTNTDMTWTDSSGQLFQLRTSGSSPPSFSTESPAETNHKSERIMRFDGDSTLVSTNATITNNKNNSSRGGLSFPPPPAPQNPVPTPQHPAGGQQHRVSGHNCEKE